MEKTDAELVAEYFAGDESALKFLIERYLRSVYNFAYRYMGTTDDADDVTQEAFLKAWKNLKRYRSEQSFKTWLFSIARNTAIDWLRKKKNVPLSEFETDDGDNALIDALSDPLPLSPELMAQAEDKKTLELVLPWLPRNYRAVLLLRYAEELTFVEIGRVLGKPLHTVKSQHRRALMRLRSLLRDKLNG